MRPHSYQWLCLCTEHHCSPFPCTRLVDVLLQATLILESQYSEHSPRVTNVLLDLNMEHMGWNGLCTALIAWRWEPLTPLDSERFQYIWSSDAETKTSKESKHFCVDTHAITQVQPMVAAPGRSTTLRYLTPISQPASTLLLMVGRESERARDYWLISWGLRKGFLNCMLSFIIIVLHLCGVDTLQRSIDKGAHKKPCPLCSTPDKCRKNALNLNTSFGLAAFPFPPFHLSFWVQIHYNANYFMCFNA